MADTPSKVTVAVKSVRTPASPDDGQRILVDRLWPRGVSKSKARVDHWIKDVAPSDALRRWFAHDPKKWTAFKRRYHAELRRNDEAVAPLAELMSQGKAALLFGAADAQHNNAVALAEYLRQRGAAAGARASAPARRRAKPAGR